jgi:hypothetical protein
MVGSFLSFFCHNGVIGKVLIDFFFSLVSFSRRFFLDSEGESSAEGNGLGVINSSHLMDIIRDYSHHSAACLFSERLSSL